MSLLRHAAPEDQLWGLAAVKELLLQGVHNLAAAEGAALNSVLIEWLQEAVAAAPAETAAGAAGEPAGSAAEGSTAQQAGQEHAQHAQHAQHDAQQLDSRLLVHQLLAVLTLSGSYSIAGAVDWMPPACAVLRQCAKMIWLQSCAHFAPPDRPPATLLPS